MINSVLFLLFLGTASAAEEIVHVEKGEAAPFSGTLFNEEAAANILLRLETEKTRCELLVQEALAKQKVINDYEMSIVKIQMDGQKKRCDEIIKIKTESIEYLNNQVISNGKSWKNSLWYSAGVLSGIGITMLSAWSLSQIAAAK